MRTVKPCMCVVVGDLATAAQAQHQVERRFLLDVVIGERAAVLELLTSENQTLLVRREAYLRAHERITSVSHHLHIYKRTSKRTTQNQQRPISPVDRREAPFRRLPELPPSSDHTIWSPHPSPARATPSPTTHRSRTHSHVVPHPSHPRMHPSHIVHAHNSPDRRPRFIRSSHAPSLS